MDSSQSSQIDIALLIGAILIGAVVVGGVIYFQKKTKSKRKSFKKR